MDKFHGERVKERREGLGWTRQMLSLKWFARFGQPLSIQTITNWEKGKWQPHSDNLMRLARLLNVSTAYFYQEQEGKDNASMLAVR